MTDRKAKKDSKIKEKCVIADRLLEIRMGTFRQHTVEIFCT